jgi:excisionase family DNA binding protein
MENASQVRPVGSGHSRMTEQEGPCAYVLVIPRIEGPVLETIEKFISVLSSQQPVTFLAASGKPELEIVDSWLEHNAAAEYLGVGRSTLYRYSEHQEIESRKFCGRLQYRLSSLDEFKARHVRPSRHSDNHSGILPSAPRSGK